MEAQLVYKSSWCKAEPIVYENNNDAAVDRLIGKVFANKVNRLTNEGGKTYYKPSEEYHRYVASVKHCR